MIYRLLRYDPGRRSCCRRSIASTPVAASVATSCGPSEQTELDPSPHAAEVVTVCRVNRDDG